MLNQINTEVPERFAGYETRLFNSLSTGTIRYFVIREPDFFQKLDPAVLLKLSPEALKLVPADVIASLPADTAAQVQAIASGDQPPAVAGLGSETTAQVAPADPNAPALNSEWATIASFVGHELDTADDLLRFSARRDQFHQQLVRQRAGREHSRPVCSVGLSPEAVAYHGAG